MFDWKARRILIVDRDSQFRFWARSVFKHQQVREALSVSYPVAVSPLLLRHDISVAFIELSHEETGLMDFLQWLRNRRTSPSPDMPVVLLTKTIERTQLSRACTFGIHGILQKPVSGEMLLNAVVGVLTNPRIVKVGPEQPAEPVRPVPPDAPPKVGTDPRRPAAKPLAAKAIAGGRTDGASTTASAGPDQRSADRQVTAPRFRPAARSKLPPGSRLRPRSLARPRPRRRKAGTAASKRRRRQWRRNRSNWRRPANRRRAEPLPVPISQTSFKFTSSG